MQDASRSSQPADLRRVGIHPDHWYPLLRSRRLKRGRILPVRFAGQAIAIGRTEGGTAFALEDRCAHRQFPLSRGVIQGERLVCGYHQWAYGKGGRCVGNPHLPPGEKMPRGVRPYPTREAYGHVFVFPGDAGRAEQVPLPRVPAWGAPTHRTMYFRREIDCHYSFMHENLMDMSHQFLHRRLMGQITPSILETRRSEDSLEVDYRFADDGSRQHWGAELLVRGKSDLPEADDHVIMTVATRYPYQELSVRLPGRQETAFDLWAVYVPLDAEQRRNVSVGMLTIRRPSVPGLIHLMWPVIRRFTLAILAQDRAAVEAEQRAYDEQGADWNHETSPLIRELKELLARRGVGLAATDPRGRMRPARRPDEEHRASPLGLAR